MAGDPVGSGTELYLRLPRSIASIEYQKADVLISSRVGATSLFLATKVEENCRKMKELVIACCRVAQKDPHKLVDEQDKEYWRWRDVILLSEDVMLEAICFDLSLEPPYKTLFEQLVLFGEDDNRTLRNAAWAFVNDSYLTMLCLLFSSRTIATSALYAAAKHCGVTILDDEQGRPWWYTAGVELEEIKRACNYMASVYDSLPSKGGKESGMYERMQENEDDINDATRLARPARLDYSRLEEHGVNGPAISPGSEPSQAIHPKRSLDDRGSEVHKPILNGIGHHTNGDLTLRDGPGGPRKRQRLGDGAPSAESTSLPDESMERALSHGENNTKSLETSIPSTHVNGTILPESTGANGGGPVSPKVDDVSEEGEVEA